MDANTLFEKLTPIQEKKGYYFNNDKEKVLELLGALLTNKDRYGHMACPCRLASGDRDSDKDIICPCDYREPDVKEFGSCFCDLYVSEDRLKGRIQSQYVPERRPAHKMDEL